MTKNKHKKTFWFRLDDITEYNKVTELWEDARHYRKLMSAYGFDENTNQWDLKKAPVTRSDKDIEGMNSDIDKCKTAVEEYNNFVEYLAKKYQININEMEKTHPYVEFIPPPTAQDMQVDEESEYTLQCPICIWLAIEDEGYDYKANPNKFPKYEGEELFHHINSKAHTKSEIASIVALKTFLGNLTDYYD